MNWKGLYVAETWGKSMSQIGDALVAVVVIATLTRFDLIIVVAYKIKKLLTG